MSFANGPGFLRSGDAIAALAADPEGARDSLLEPDGSYPLNGFTLEDHTDSVLAAGIYAEDALGRLRRHDGVLVGETYEGTTGGVLVIPQRYVGFSVVDFTGKGGSGAGTVVPLEDLLALFDGVVVAGDQIQIFGQTSIALNPADLPNATPAFWGISFGNTAGEVFFDFWDLSNEAGTATYHDLRTWSLTITYNGTSWDISSPACFAVQQKAAAAGGAATVITGALGVSWGLSPTPGNAVDGVFTVPMSLVLVDSGTPFTTGEARVTWDLTLNIVRG